MHMYHDPDEWETIIEHGDFGCLYSQKRRDPKEVLNIKREKERIEEDRILALAEAIKTKRAAEEK